MNNEAIKNIYQEQLNQEINERSKVWEEIIKESEIKQQKKEDLLSLVNGYKQKQFQFNEQLYDVAKRLISQILTILNNAKTKEESAVFENIRDDVWEMYRSISKYD